MGDSMPTVRKEVRERVKKAAQKQSEARASRRPPAPWIPNEKGYRWKLVDGEAAKVKRDA